LLLGKRSSREFFSQNNLFWRLQVSQNEEGVRGWFNTLIGKVEVYTSQQLHCGLYSSADAEVPYYVRGILADGSAQGGYRGKTDLVSLEQKRVINNRIPNPSFASLVAIEFKHHFSDGEIPWYNLSPNLGPEMWGSFFGQDARVGACIAKNGFKIFWRVGNRPNYHLYQYPNGNTIVHEFDAEENHTEQLLLFRLCQLFLREGVPPKVEAKKNKVKPHGGTPDTFQKIRKQAKVDAKPDNTGTARALDFTKYGYI